MGARGTALRVDSFDQALRLLDGTALRVRDEACANVRGRVEFCARCADACPAGALDPGCDEVGLDEERCTGCGACLASCPAGALTLVGFDPARLLDALDASPLVHLHCAESVDGGGGVVLPCFQLMDARLAAAALERGARTLVLHGLERCGACRRGSALEAVTRVRDTLTEWFGEGAPAIELAAAGERVAGVRRRVDRPRIGRRGFLRVTGGQGAAQAAVWMLPVAGGESPVETLAAPPPFFQSETLEQRPDPYQEALAGAAPTLPWSPSAPLPFRLRSVSDACAACLACGQRCPTGALRACERGARRRLLFDPWRCTDCRLCERVCPHDAIEVRVPVRVAELAPGTAVLLERSVAPCRGCGQATELAALAGGTCLQCGNEQEMDDEWLAMMDG